MIQRCDPPSIVKETERAMQSIEKNDETHEGLQKKQGHMKAPKYRKNDGHMKAHRKIYMLAISPNKS